MIDSGKLSWVDSITIQEIAEDTVGAAMAGRSVCCASSDRPGYTYKIPGPVHSSCQRMGKVVSVTIIRCDYNVT